MRNSDEIQKYQTKEVADNDDIVTDDAMSDLEDLPNN